MPRFFLSFLPGLLILVGASLPQLLWAIDIAPSRDNIPNKDTTQGESHFSIFSGDPARIQRANSIDFKDFTPTLQVTPTEVSLSTLHKDASAMRPIRVTFEIKNIGKRTYTLSFPNAQRYELTVKDPQGRLVYQWSNDKKFSEEVGVVMINPTDRIGYTEAIPLSALYAPLEVGTYTIEFSIANYQEVSGKGTFKILP